MTQIPARVQFAGASEAALGEGLLVAGQRLRVHTLMLGDDCPESNEFAFLRSQGEGFANFTHRAVGEEFRPLVVALDHSGIPTAFKTVG